ncbi:Hypothetical predicted protein, partial [Olea europaea subsp. europaea]
MRLTNYSRNLSTPHRLTDYHNGQSTIAMKYRHQFDRLRQLTDYYDGRNSTVMADLHHIDRPTTTM